MVWKLQAVVIFSASEETKLVVDTTSIILSYFCHFGNANKELLRQNLHNTESCKQMPHDKIDKIIFKVPVMENFKRQ